MEATARSESGDQRTPDSILNIPRRVLSMERLLWFWDVSQQRGTGPIHKINGIMDRFVYKDIMEDVMLPHAEGRCP